MNTLNYPSLEGKTNEELFTLYKETHAQEVKQELTMRYVYIVRSIAYQMREMYHDFMQTDDIVNEGVIEIMRAIERYDESRDNKFETYISRRIRGNRYDAEKRLASEKLSQRQPEYRAGNRRVEWSFGQSAQR